MVLVWQISFPLHKLSHYTICYSYVTTQHTIVPLDKPAQYAYQMVRTDSREMKLDAFIRPSSLQQQQQPSQSVNPQADPDNQSSPTEMDTTTVDTGSEGCVNTLCILFPIYKFLQGHQQRDHENFKTSPVAAAVLGKNVQCTMLMWTLEEQGWRYNLDSFFQSQNSPLVHKLDLNNQDTFRVGCVPILHCFYRISFTIV